MNPNTLPLVSTAAHPRSLPLPQPLPLVSNDELVLGIAEIFDIILTHPCASSTAFEDFAAILRIENQYRFPQPWFESVNEETDFEELAFEDFRACFLAKFYKQAIAFVAEQEELAIVSQINPSPPLVSAPSAVSASFSATAAMVSPSFSATAAAASPSFSATAAAASPSFQILPETTISQCSPKMVKNVKFDKGTLLLHLCQFPDENQDHLEKVKDCLGLEDEKSGCALDVNNIYTPQQWLTPLHIACSYGFVEVAKLLIERAGAAVNITDKEGWTPLHCACAEGQVEVVEMLMKCQGNLAHQEEGGGKGWIYPFDGPINLEQENYDGDIPEEVSHEDKEDVLNLVLKECKYSYPRPPRIPREPVSDNEEEDEDLEDDEPPLPQLKETPLTPLKTDDLMRAITSSKSPSSNQEKSSFQKEAPIITEIPFGGKLSVPNASGDPDRPPSPNTLATILIPSGHGAENIAFFPSGEPSSALTPLPACEEPPLPAKYEAPSLTDNKDCPGFFSASMTTPNSIGGTIFSNTQEDVFKNFTSGAIDKQDLSLLPLSKNDLYVYDPYNNDVPSKLDTSFFAADLALDDEFEDMVAVSMSNLISRGRCNEKGSTLSLNSKTVAISCKKETIRFPKEKYVKTEMPAIDTAPASPASLPISPQSQEPKESVGADTVEELKYSSSIKKDSDFKAIFWKDLKEFNISPSLTVEVMHVENVEEYASVPPAAEPAMMEAVAIHGEGNKAKRFPKCRKFMEKLKSAAKRFKQVLFQKLVAKPAKHLSGES